jgi:hypothetical protein
MRKSVLTVIATVLLGGCGGGDSSGASGANPAAGIYYGTLLTDSSSPQLVELFGMVDGQGNALFVEKSGSALAPTFQLLAPGRIYPGGSDNISVPYTLYNSDGSSNSTGTFSASVSPASAIVGTLTATGSSTRTAGLQLDYQQSEWETPASLATIAGSYSYSSNGVKATATIDSSGALKVSAGSGCTGSGTISVPDSTRNGYQVSYTSTCLGGSFSGIGSYTARTLTAPAVFRVGLSNGNSGAYLKLTEQ